MTAIFTRLRHLRTWLVPRTAEERQRFIAKHHQRQGDEAAIGRAFDTLVVGQLEMAAGLEEAHGQVDGDDAELFEGLAQKILATIEAILFGGDAQPPRPTRVRFIEPDGTFVTKLAVLASWLAEHGDQRVAREYLPLTRMCLAAADDCLPETWRPASADESEEQRLIEVCARDIYNGVQMLLGKRARRKRREADGSA